MEIAINDCVSIQLKFADDSICSVNYFSNGPRNCKKNELKSLQMAIFKARQFPPVDINRVARLESSL